MSWELQNEDSDFKGMPEENKQHLLHYFWLLWIQETVTTLSITCNWTKTKRVNDTGSDKRQ